MSIRAAGSLLRVTGRRQYYNPVKKSEAVKINDGAADGGIATPKDMSPLAQEIRFHRQFLKDLHAKKKAQATMNKEEYLKFCDEFEKSKGSKLTKVPTTIEELPQSDQDWLAGKDPSHPLKYHPFVMERAKKMLAGTWVPAVSRPQGHKNEFGQPLNDPQSWLDHINNTKWEYFDDVGSLTPRIGGSRTAVTKDVLKAILRGMLKCDRQNASVVGNVGMCMCDLVYDYKFVHGIKPDEEVWNLLLEGAVKLGDWRFAYAVEDAITSSGFKANADLLKKADEHARYAWEHGYMLPPRMQGKDIADFFKIDTRGGVGAYIPFPDGMSKGYEMWEIYKQQEKQGTFVPAMGSPAWDTYIKDKPDLQKLDPRAAQKAFMEDFALGKAHMPSSAN